MAFFNLPFSVRIAGSDPIDGDRYIASDLTERNNLIGSGREFNGLQVYVESEEKLYLLVDKDSVIWTELIASGTNGESLQSTFTTRTYRTVQSGDWEDVSTFQIKDDNDNWVAAHRIPSMSDVLYIEAGHTVTINENQEIKDIWFNGSIDVKRLVFTSGTSLNLNVWGDLYTYTGDADSVVIDTSSGGSGTAGWLDTNQTESTISIVGLVDREILGNFTANSRVSGWNCVIRALSGATFTTGKTVRSGYLTIASGTLDVNLEDWRISGSDTDAQPGNGIATGTLIVKDGARFNAANLHKNGVSNDGNQLASITIEKGGVIRANTSSLRWSTNSWTCDGTLEFINGIPDSAGAATTITGTVQIDNSYILKAVADNSGIYEIPYDFTVINKFIVENENGDTFTGSGNIIYGENCDLVYNVEQSLGTNVSQLLPTNGTNGEIPRDWIITEPITLLEDKTIRGRIKLEDNGSINLNSNVLTQGYIGNTDDILNNSNISGETLTEVLDSLSNNNTTNVFVSKQSGNWTDSTSWYQVDSNNNFVDAKRYPNGLSDDVYIEDGNSIVLDSNGLNVKRLFIYSVYDNSFDGSGTNGFRFDLNDNDINVVGDFGYYSGSYPNILPVSNGSVPDKPEYFIVKNGPSNSGFVVLKNLYNEELIKVDYGFASRHTGQINLKFNAVQDSIQQLNITYRAGNYVFDNCKTKVNDASRWFADLYGDNNSDAPDGSFTLQNGAILEGTYILGQGNNLACSSFILDETSQLILKHPFPSVHSTSFIMDGIVTMDNIQASGSTTQSILNQGNNATVINGAVDIDYFSTLELLGNVSTGSPVSQHRMTTSFEIRKELIFTDTNLNLNGHILTYGERGALRYKDVSVTTTNNEFPFIDSSTSGMIPNDLIIDNCTVTLNSNKRIRGELKLVNGGKLILNGFELITNTTNTIDGTSGFVSAFYTQSFNDSQKSVARNNIDSQKETNSWEENSIFVGDTTTNEMRASSLSVDLEAGGVGVLSTAQTANNISVRANNAASRVQIIASPNSISGPSMSVYGVNTSNSDLAGFGYLYGPLENPAAKWDGDNFYIQSDTGTLILNSYTDPTNDISGSLVAEGMITYNNTSKNISFSDGTNWFEPLLNITETGGSGITISSNSINWNGALSDQVEITGNSTYPMFLGTTSSKLAYTEINSQNALILRSGASQEGTIEMISGAIDIELDAGGETTVVQLGQDGVYLGNSSRTIVRAQNDLFQTNNSNFDLSFDGASLDPNGYRISDTRSTAYGISYGSDYGSNWSASTDFDNMLVYKKWVENYVAENSGTGGGSVVEANLDNVVRVDIDQSTSFSVLEKETARNNIDALQRPNSFNSVNPYVGDGVDGIVQSNLQILENSNGLLLRTDFGNDIALWGNNIQSSVGMKAGAGDTNGPSIFLYGSGHAETANQNRGVINADGRVQIAYWDDDNFEITTETGALILNSYTNPTADVSSPLEGMLTFNTTTSNLNLYSSTSWKEIATSEFVLESLENPFSVNNSTSGVTWDYSTTSNYDLTLEGDITLSITNVQNGDYGTIILRQDATGSRSITLPNNSLVANGGNGSVTLTSNGNAIDILSFVYDGTNFLWNTGFNYT